MRASAAILTLCLASSACAPSAPPRDLDGLWSAGPAACEAGVGLRFGADAIEAVYDGEAETLFDQPRYRTERRHGALYVRIRYELPSESAHGASYGELVLRRRNDGWLTPVSNRWIDARTGAARLRIGDDPLKDALTVRPCAPNAWIANLRGRR